MTGNHFRHGEQHLDEAVFALSGMTADANSGEHRQSKTHCGAVHDRSIAFDRAGFLQQFDPSRTRRRRQADPLGQYAVRQSGVRLQFAQDLQVNSVKISRIGRIGHGNPD